MRTVAAPAASSRLWLYAAALLSVVAAFTHMVVASRYFTIWVGYGLFFSFAMALQLMYAILLWVHHTLWGDQPRPVLLWAGILGTALIIALWVVAHTVGIPLFGPRAGLVEPVGAPDVIALAAEIGLIVCLLALARNGRGEQSA